MKKNYKYIYITLSILLLIGIIVSFSQAKYISNSVWNYYLKSKGFYFESDDLTSLGANIVKNDWNEENIYFNIRNNLNRSVISSYDITYNVLCSVESKHADKVSCHLNGTQDSTINGTLTSIEACKNNKDDGVDVKSYSKSQCELEEYLWERQISSKELYFNLVSEDEGYKIEDIKVNIKVDSTSPYNKTLLGEYTLYKNNNLKDKISLDFKNYNNFDKLLIHNYYNEEKCLNLKWDSNKLIIDTALNKLISYRADNDNYLNEIEFKIAKNTSIIYNFYRKDFLKEYSVDEFTYELLSSCS